MNKVLIVEDAGLFFARQHDNHMQKYRWNLYTSKFKVLTNEEILRAAGLMK